MIKNLIIAMAVAAMAVCSFSVDAKEKTKKQNIDIYDLSIDDNIAMPELEKQAETIKKFQYNQAIALKEQAKCGDDSRRRSDNYYHSGRSIVRA